MSEWWTYRPGDFLLFSPRTYYRLVESYNRDLWPAHLAAVLCGIAILALALRGLSRWKGSAVSAILAAAWLWVAWAFHFERYMTINWAAKWFAVGFAAEALLIAWSGVIRGAMDSGGARQGSDPFRRVRHAGLILFAFALCLEPLIGPLAGRSWKAIEVFGIHPDPTAIATLGIVLLAAGRVRWELLLIPVAWCAVSGATLQQMGSPDAAVAPVAAVIALSVALWKRLVTRRESRSLAHVAGS